jgi:hypothetical protein
VWGVILLENRRSFFPRRKVHTCLSLLSRSICWAVDNKIPCILQVWTYHIIPKQQVRRRSLLPGNREIPLCMRTIRRWVFRMSSYLSYRSYIHGTYLGMIHRFFPMVRFKSTSTCSPTSICREEWIDTYISIKEGRNSGKETSLAFFGSL